MAILLFVSIPVTLAAVPHAALLGEIAVFEPVAVPPAVPDSAKE